MSSLGTCTLQTTTPLLLHRSTFVDAQQNSKKLIASRIVPRLDLRRRFASTEDYFSIPADGPDVGPARGNPNDDAPMSAVENAKKTPP